MGRTPPASATASCPRITPSRASPLVRGLPSCRSPQKKLVCSRQARPACLAWDPVAAFADAVRHRTALDAGLDEAQSTLLFFASSPDARQEVALPLRALRRAGSVTVRCVPDQLFGIWSVRFSRELKSIRIAHA